jgi:hypothetical protein
MIRDGGSLSFNPSAALAPVGLWLVIIFLAAANGYKGVVGILNEEAPSVLNKPRVGDRRCESRRVHLRHRILLKMHPCQLLGC